MRSSAAEPLVVSSEPPTAAELKSVTGADFMPLATALLAGDFKEADQLTRDLLIFIAGPGVGGLALKFCAHALNEFVRISRLSGLWTWQVAGSNQIKYLNVFIIVIFIAVFINLPSADR